MSSSDDTGGLLALLLLPFLILFVIAYFVVLVGSLIAFIAIWIALGIGANVMVRYAIGLLGDKLGATPAVARLGLALVFLTPPAFLSLTFVFALCLALFFPVGGSAYASLMLLGWFFSLVLSAPGYYWAFFAKEVPKVHWKLELPLKTDSAMQAEWRILSAQIRAFYHTLQFRLQLLRLELSDGATR